LAGIALNTRNRMAHKATSEALAMAEQLSAKQDNELRLREEREAKLLSEVAMRQQVHAFNAELVESIKAFGAMIDGLSRTSAKLSAAALQAREGGGNVAQAADRAAHRVAEVAASADRLADAANEVADKARESSTIFRKTASDAAAANATNEGLNRAMAQIDSMVGTIRKISEQTNLLALNATIEAARAGAAGRGFSVVASEVKALATQTASATTVIGTQIGAIHEAGTASVNMLQQIREQIRTVESISNEVNTVVVDQRASAQSIASTMRTTAAETEQVSASAHALAQATQSACDSVSDVLGVASELRQEANRISAAVDGFAAALRSA
jgi:methyl-accepting chemotaxis protein